MKPLRSLACIAALLVVTPEIKAAITPEAAAERFLSLHFCAGKDPIKEGFVADFKTIHHNTALIRYRIEMDEEIEHMDDLLEEVQGKIYENFKIPPKYWTGQYPAKLPLAVYDGSVGTYHDRHYKELTLDKIVSGPKLVTFRKRQTPAEAIVELRLRKSGDEWAATEYSYQGPDGADKGSANDTGITEENALQLFPELSTPSRILLLRAIGNASNPMVPRGSSQHAELEEQVSKGYSTFLSAKVATLKLILKEIEVDLRIINGLSQPGTKIKVYDSKEDQFLVAEITGPMESSRNRSNSYSAPVLLSTPGVPTPRKGELYYNISRNDRKDEYLVSGIPMRRLLLEVSPTGSNRNRPSSNNTLLNILQDRSAHFFIALTRDLDFEANSWPARLESSHEGDGQVSIGDRFYFDLDSIPSNSAPHDPTNYKLSPLVTKEMTPELWEMLAALRLRGDDDSKTTNQPSLIELIDACKAKVMALPGQTRGRDPSRIQALREALQLIEMGVAIWQTTTEDEVLLQKITHLSSAVAVQYLPHIELHDDYVNASMAYPDEFSRSIATLPEGEQPEFNRQLKALQTIRIEGAH